MIFFFNDISFIFSSNDECCKKKFVTLMQTEKRENVTKPLRIDSSNFHLYVRFSLSVAFFFIQIQKLLFKLAFFPLCTMSRKKSITGTQHHKPIRICFFLCLNLKCYRESKKCTVDSICKLCVVSVCGKPQKYFPISKACLREITSYLKTHHVDRGKKHTNTHI